MKKMKRLPSPVRHLIHRKQSFEITGDDRLNCGHVVCGTFGNGISTRIFKPCAAMRTAHGKDVLRLFDLNFGACGFKLLLDFFRFLLLAAFLELLRSALDELLRFSQA